MKVIWLGLSRPFPRGIGNWRWLLVDTDYFTKWVEAKHLANIRDVDAKRFIWRNIVTRFGVPHTLISDNGLQLNSKAFRRYCRELGIRNRYSIPAYPQGNGQAEATNKVIVSGLKKRTPKENGWMNFPMCCGPIVPHLENQQGRLLFHWLMGQRQ